MNLVPFLAALLMAGGVWDRAGAIVRRLWEKPEPSVTEGNARAAGGDVDGALRKYEEARVPERGPAAAALALDKASALLRQGDPQAAPKALAEASRAFEEGNPGLKPLAAYDLASALEQSGRSDEAVGAYQRVLQLDPADEDAKVNLELLLREEQRKKKQPSAQGKPDENKKQQQAGQDQKQRQSGNEQRKNDPEPQAGDAKKGQQGERKEQDMSTEQTRAQQGRPEQSGDKKQQQAAALRPMDRTEAQRLLDALRAGEKNLQVWRFGPQKAKERRPDVEKDW